MNDFGTFNDLQSALVTKAKSGEELEIELMLEDENLETPHHNIFLSEALQAKHLRDMAQQKQLQNSMLEEIVGSSSPEVSTMDANDVVDPSKSTSEDPTEYDWVLENYDKKTTEPQCLDDEIKRLLVLKSYLILDAEREEVFETITGLAGRIMKCPIALVSLIDLGRQWFMSNRGLDFEVRETSRKTAFCAHAIMSTEDLFIVRDASKDFRFKDNPLVTGPPDIRFYAGAPLMSPEGFKLGTLCVIDSTTRPNGLTLEEKQNMKELAAMTVEAMTRRRQRLYTKHNDPAQVIAQIAHDLLTPLTGVQLSLATLTEDEKLSSQLTTAQKDLLFNASQCSDAVEKICATAISELRTQQARQAPERSKSSDTLEGHLKTTRAKAGRGVRRHNSAAAYQKGKTNDVSIERIETKAFVNALYTVLEAFPKSVPVLIKVDPGVPKELSMDELKIFRSALNYLSDACMRTHIGSIQLTIRNTTDDDGFHHLLFECVDTAPDIQVEQYPLLFKPLDYDDGVSCIKPTMNGGCEPICQTQTTGLGLYSVAIQIGSLGGEYGFRPRKSGMSQQEQKDDAYSLEGSIFWFKVPLLLNN